MASNNNVKSFIKKSLDPHERSQFSGLRIPSREIHVDVKRR